MPTIFRKFAIRPVNRFSFTKNGVGDMVVMSLETYERQQSLINLYAKLAEAEEEIMGRAEGEDFLPPVKPLPDISQTFKYPIKTEVANLKQPLFDMINTILHV